MAITRIDWKSSNLQEWEKQRGEVEGLGCDYTRFGASDISVIMGSNKWKCPQRLFFHSTGYYSSFITTERTAAGHLQEEVTKKWWEGWETDKEQGIRNALAGYRNRAIKKAEFFLLNDKYPNLFVSMDYVPDEDEGEQFSPWTGEQYHPLTPHEMKHTTDSYFGLWPKYKNFPTGITQSYMEQVQTQMMVSETEVAVFLTLVDGVKFHPIEIEADKVMWEKIDHYSRLFGAKVDFGKQILKNLREADPDDIVYISELTHMYEQTAPDPIGMDDNTKLLKEVYKRGNGLELIGTRQDEVDMERYLDLNRFITDSEEEKALIRNILINRMSDFEYLKAGDRKLTNRRASGGKKAYFSIT